jgi:predicted Zn-ribbon and HTH transcriptional regulator
MPTIRQEMIRLLVDAEMSARDLSQALKIREKDVYDHLRHIKRSVDSSGKTLRVMAARCLGCGYIFESRDRFTSPGKCPRCKNEHIEDPKYRIDSCIG